MEIIEARPEHFPEIVEMIRKVWTSTYRHILTEKQLDFMQIEFNTISVFQKQWDLGQVFYIALDQQKIIGFTSLLQLNEIIRIPKLYVDSTFQRKGVGKKLLQTVEKYARDNQLNSIELNVNRYNKALYFYRRYGFYILSSVDISFGDFWLNDYVMRLDL